MASPYELFQQLHHGMEPPPAVPTVDLDVEIIRLRDAFAVWATKHPPFQPGDLVRERGGIRIGSLAASVNNVFVVMDTHPEAEIGWNPADRTSYGVRFDLQLGCYDRDGDFVFMWTDSRRYEPFPEPETIP